MNQSTRTAICCALLFFACIGEDKDAVTDNEDMSGSMAIDGGTSGQLDGPHPLEDMMLSIDVARPCTDDERRPSPSPCGLNEEGFLFERCTAGSWQLTDDCSGMDICTNGDQRNGATPCGANDEGFLQQFCRNGQWVGTTECSDSSECRTGQTRETETVCGLNGEGVLLDECANGMWVPSQNCTGTDMCLNLSTQVGTTACGLNNEGFLNQVCENGQWIDTDACTGNDICTNGTTQNSTESCGEDDAGRRIQICQMGAWVTSELCSSDACMDGEMTSSAAVCASGMGVEVNRCENMVWVTTLVCPNEGAQTQTALGRRVDFTLVDLNNTGRNIDTVIPGSTVRLRATGSVTNLRTSCPTCITQFYLRMNTVFNLCLGSQTGNWNFDEQTEFTAPERAGVYYINRHQSWEFRCIESTNVSEQYNSRTAAILIVEDEGSCTEGQERSSNITCGLNNEGVFSEVCVNGQWSISQTCSGTDICENGARQDGTTTCGLNDEGTLFQTCDNGRWIDTSDCSGADECINGESRDSGETCGDDNQGQRIEICERGRWSLSNDCSERVCTDGEQASQIIDCEGQNGITVSICNDGRWIQTDVCPTTGEMTLSARGRRLDISRVDLNESGLNIATVAPSSTVRLRTVGTFTSLNTSCPGCITQFYLRMHDVFNLCLGSTTGTANFDETIAFTAPMTPGVYFINPTHSWEYECSESTSISTNYTPQTAGVVIVAEGGGATNPNEPEPPNTLCDLTGLAAGEGTVRVQAFNNEYINWATAKNARFSFPASTERFASAKMNLAIECPPGGCDPWDRFGNVSLRHSDGQVYEIARLVTPYDIGAGIGGPGSCNWSYDVSPYLHLLRGEQELSLFISTWINDERGWQVSIDFEFERGVPELEVYRVVTLWDYGHLVYGNPNIPIDDFLTSQSIEVDAQAVAAKVRVAVTGHGQGNTDNAAEFSRRWHRVSTSTVSKEWTPWRFDCAQNTCSPQGGTWPYGRAGWCPGSGVWPELIDISADIDRGQPITIDYEIEPYENCCRPDNPSCDANDGSCCIPFAGECAFNYTGHTEPSFDLNAQVILYRCPQ